MSAHFKFVFFIIAISITDTNEDETAPAPIFARVYPDGLVRVNSPQLIAEGRGQETIKIQVFGYDYSYEPEVLIVETSGPASNTTFKGLEAVQEYLLKVTWESDGKEVTHTEDLSGAPSCDEGQKLVSGYCYWYAPKSLQVKWSDAIEYCAKRNNFLHHTLRKRFTKVFCRIFERNGVVKPWINMTKTDFFQMEDENMRESCTKGSLNDKHDPNDPICCACDKDDQGEYTVTCGCCEEEHPFLCMNGPYERIFGHIAEVNPEEITTNSVRITWKNLRPTKWANVSYNVKWDDLSNEPDENVGLREIFTDKTTAVVENLRPSTEYRITVSPAFQRTAQVISSSIVVTTRSRDEELQIERAYRCPLKLAEILSCFAVLLGSAVVLCLFIRARMFYLDSLAHMCSEISLCGAYICVCVCSSQAFFQDEVCLRASPKTCKVSAMLIQFFFQAALLFSAFEAMEMGQLLDNGCFKLLPEHMTITPGALIFYGWGIPASVIGVLAAVASDQFSDGTTNCWLKMDGTAFIPVFVPIMLFVVCHLILLVPLLLRNQKPRESLSTSEHKRALTFLKLRWVSLLLLFLVLVCYLTGLLFSAQKDASLEYAFVAFSFLLALIQTALKILFENKVMKKLRCGLFSKSEATLSRARSTPVRLYRNSTPQFTVSGKVEGEMSQEAKRQPQMFMRSETSSLTNHR